MNRYAMTVTVASLALRLAAAADQKENLLPNGSFEQVQAGVPVAWIYATEGGDPAEFRIIQQEPKDGRNVLRIAGNVTWAVAISTHRIPADPQQRYTLTGYVRVPRGQALIKFDYFKDDQHLGHTLQPGQIVQAGNEWTRISVRSETELHPTATHLLVTVAILGNAEGHFDALNVTAVR